MPALNFQKRFAQAVSSGAKTHTIRKRRTPPIEAGQHLTLWTGQRTKKCQPLGDATCTDVEPIRIFPARHEIWVWDKASEQVDEDGDIVGRLYLLKPQKAEAFAKADGFNNLQELFDFFETYPLDVLRSDLVLIHWRLGWDKKKGG